jgi:hypothetical protein
MGSMGAAAVEESRGAVMELVALGVAQIEINTYCGGDEKEIDARVDCEVVVGSR